MRINRIDNYQIIKSKDASSKNPNFKASFKGAWSPGCFENTGAAISSGVAKATTGLTGGVLALIALGTLVVAGLISAKDQAMREMSQKDYDDEIDMMIYRDRMYG